MLSYLPAIQVDKQSSSPQFRHKIKLSLLFIVPLLISINAALFQIDKLTTRASQLTNLEQLTNLTLKISHLLHELQKERGYAGVYLATNGSKFTTELAKQRQLVTVSKRHIYKLLAANNFTVSSKFNTRLASFNHSFTEFGQIRLQVDNFTIDEVNAIKLYSQLNQKLIDLLATIVQSTVDSELTQAFAAYMLFIKGKEKVAIERVTFSVIFARGELLDNEYNELVKLELEQNIFFHEFSELASHALQRSFSALVNEQAFELVQQIKTQVLINHHIKTNVNDWFKAITNKLDKLELLGEKISLELISNANRLKQNSQQERLYWLAALVIFFIVISSAGFWLIINIHRSALNKIKEYQGLFSKNLAAMVVIDVKSQNIRYGNQSFSELVGYNQQQLSKLNIIDFHRKKDIEKIKEIFNQLVSGQTSVAEKILFIRNKGEVFYADIFAFPITIEKQAYLAVHVIDITSKLRAKQYIQQSEQTLKMILDSIASAVVVLEDNKQPHVYMNKKAIEIYQNKDENQSTWCLFRDNFFSNINDDLTNNSITKKKYFNKSKQRWYQITSTMIDWSDGRTVCLKMLKDITESCDAERRNKNLLTENRQLLCRNYLILEQERKHIAQELHDELGQLLTGIKLQADFICRQTGKADETLRVSSHSIVQATNALIESTRNITNNLRPIILDQLGLVDAIKELVQNWRQLNNNIHFELNTESIPYGLNDEIQISVYRIVQEGITNACKHADARHIEISLKFITSSDEKKHSLLQLKIKDDGKGFNQEHEHSNGMGIINMRERTEALNGVFCLINKQKQGAEIFITIPLELLTQEELCH